VAFFSSNLTLLTFDSFVGKDVDDLGGEIADLRGDADRSRRRCLDSLGDGDFWRALTFGALARASRHHRPRMQFLRILSICTVHHDLMGPSNSKLELAQCLQQLLASRLFYRSAT